MLTNVFIVLCVALLAVPVAFLGANMASLRRTDDGRWDRATDVARLDRAMLFRPRYAPLR